MKSYLRFLSRNKLYTAIEVVGLSLALAFVVLIGTYVWQQLETAHNIKDYDRIYSLGQDNGEYARVGLYLGAAESIKDNVPEIDKAGSYLDMPMQVVEFEGNEMQAKPISADKGFFEIFEWEFLTGSYDVMDDKSNAVVSESFANENGGPANVIGKKLRFRGNEFIIAAVMKEQKKSLFNNFDIVVNLDSDFNARLKRFKFYSTTVPFLKLRDGADIDDVRSKLEVEMQRIAEEMETPPGVESLIVNCKELFFSEYGYLWFNKSDMKSLKIMMFVVVLLLASAVINFVNLSTAMSMKRMKETATRMISGADGKKIFTRYVWESVSLSLFCGIIATICAIAMEPFINSLVRSDIPIDVSLSPTAIMIYAGVAILIGFSACLLPASVGSSVQPVEVIKGNFRRDNKRIFSKTFIILQNAVSVVLIALAITMQIQMKHMVNKPSGADTEDLYFLYLNDIQKRGPLEDAIKNLPFVTDVGISEGFPGEATEAGTYDQEGNRIILGMILCDSTAFRLYDFGKVSDNNSPTVNSVWMPQETFATLKSQVASIEQHPLIAGKDGTTIGGIVEDYAIFDALRDSQGALTYIKILDAQNFTPWMSDGAGLLIKTTGNHHDNKKAIEKEYRRYIELLEGKYIQPHRSGYIKDLLADKLETMNNQMRIMDLFMLISILLSFMGLVAMSTYYSTENTSDIAIRKIYGSTVKSEIIESTWKYMRIVLISCAIAIPVAVLVCGRYLDGFVYRIENYWWIYAIAVILSVLTSLAAISVQIGSAARTNPAEALKKE